MPDQPDDSAAGSPGARYEDAEDPLSSGDPGLIQAVTRHIELHLGPVRGIFHELISPGVHIDVHWVGPSAERPWHTFVTSGMSEQPMNTPAEMAGYAYAELMLALPASWPIGEAEFKDDTNFWPVRAMKALARYPHQHDTWLGFGHTVPNGDPPQPFAPSTALSGIMLLQPLQYPSGFEVCIVGERTVWFWCVVPLYDEEMILKRERGTEALLARLDSIGSTEVINPRRKNVATRRRLWPWT